MKRRAAFLSLLLLAFALPSLAGWYSAMHETETFDRATRPKTLEHKVNEQAVGTRLNVSMHVSEGVVDLKLLDASGTLRLHRVVPKGTVKFEQEFTGRSGPWKVLMNFQKAEGRYSVSLVDY